MIVRKGQEYEQAPVRMWYDAKTNKYYLLQHYTTSEHTPTQWRELAVGMLDLMDHHEYE